MKISLITTPTRTYMPNYVMPSGVMYLASYLEKVGHKVKILDVARIRQGNQSIINNLFEFKPNLIGVSGIITAYQFVKQLGIDLKKTFPKVPTVLGGHIVLDNSRNLLGNRGYDYTIKGYGEIPLAFLVEHLEGRRKIKDIPGMAYLNNGEIADNPGSVFFNNTDDIPLPAYDQIEMEHYITFFKKVPKLEWYLAKTGKPRPPMRCAPVVAARGCTDSCSYCIHEFAYKGLHSHSIDYVINNIKLLYEKYKVRIFFLGDDLFLCNTKQANKLAAAMNSNFPDAYFSCSTRANYITEELVEVLQNSNCFYLIYGFESGDNGILKILGKRMNRQTNLTAYKIISKTIIVPACPFMVGTPGETKKTVKNTIDAIKEANILNSGVFFTTPYPGSRLFRWSVQQGLIKDVDAYLNLISDRDATTLSINFTPYPNIIIKMMRILILNAIEDNLRKSNKQFATPSFKFIIKHWIVPIVYQSYFFLRKLASIFLPKYRKDTIEFALNKQFTLKLSEDEG